MKKLLTIIALVSFMGIFSACEEEEINPDNLQGTEKSSGQIDEDDGQWD